MLENLSPESLGAKAAAGGGVLAIAITLFRELRVRWAADNTKIEVSEAETTLIKNLREEVERLSSLNLRLSDQLVQMQEQSMDLRNQISELRSEVYELKHRGG